MGKTPEETKKGLECCTSRDCGGNRCPYFKEKSCNTAKSTDALAYIQQLEDHLSDARKMVERLQAERNALMGYLHSMGCDTCLHDNYDAPDSPCNDCTETRDMWEFEGV